MKNRILVVCCTRERPERAKEMYVSLIKTSHLCDVVFCIDHDDPKRKEYNHCLSGNDNIIGCGQTTTELINMAFKAYNNYSFYSVTNDDVLYETKDWDISLMNKYKISYGNDKCQGEHMPTFSIIDGDICRALGYLQMPKLIHLYGDCVWKALGTSLKILKYFPLITIRHNHYMYNKSIIKDSTYQKTNSSNMYEEDARNFENWVRDDMQTELEKIRKVI